MHLYSPQRPTLPNGRPCWLCGTVAVYVPDFWPEADGSLTLRLMLPLASGEFTARQYRASFPDILAALHWLEEFAVDPEFACESLWPNEPFNLRRPIATAFASSTTSRQRGVSAALDLVEITF